MLYFQSCLAFGKNKSHIFQIQTLYRDNTVFIIVSFMSVLPLFYHCIMSVLSKSKIRLKIERMILILRRTAVQNQWEKWWGLIRVRASYFDSEGFTFSETITIRQIGTVYMIFEVGFSPFLWIITKGGKDGNRKAGKGKGKRMMKIIEKFIQNSCKIQLRLSIFVAYWLNTNGLNQFNYTNLYPPNLFPRVPLFFFMRLSILTINFPLANLNKSVEKRFYTHKANLRYKESIWL